MGELSFFEYFEMLPVPRAFTGILKQDDETIEIIKPLKHINVFIGENNSGKSWLLRELVRHPLAKLSLKNDKIAEIAPRIINEHASLLLLIKEIENRYFEITDRIESQIEEGKIGDLSVLFETELNPQDISKSMNIIKYWNLLDSKLNSVWFDRKYLSSQYENKLEYDSYGVKTNSYQKINNSLVDFHELIESEIADLTLKISHIQNTRKIYVPPNRSLSNLVLNEKVSDMYENVYRVPPPTNFGSQSISMLEDDRIAVSITAGNIPTKKELFFGTELYKSIKSNLMESSQGRRRVIEFEDFLSVNFFGNKEIFLSPTDNDSINSASTDYQPQYKIGLTIKIGDDKDLNVHNLGTGIQMMIILTWPLFHYDNGMIFIEEPELFLHPRLQHQLMNIYATHPRAKNFQFFIATHSNHIIDNVDNQNEFSLFLMKKESENKFHLKHFDFGSTLPYETIGVRPSSLAMANCIIWVEGPSDRIYINKWIELVVEKSYPKHIKLIEGMHYQINFYGGQLISHYSCDKFGNADDFVNIVKINPNIIFVADKDRDESVGECKLKPALERIKNEIISNNEDWLWITDGREIEDYLSEDIVTLAFPNKKNDYDESSDDGKTTSKFYERMKCKYKDIKRKVDFAKKICDKLTFEQMKSSSNWLEKMENVVNQIYKFNRIDIQTTKEKQE
jgi:predicted ATP-dependent endonuclease of OLD family